MKPNKGPCILCPGPSSFPSVLASCDKCICQKYPCAKQPDNTRGNRLHPLHSTNICGVSMRARHLCGTWELDQAHHTTPHPHTPTSMKSPGNATNKTGWKTVAVCSIEGSREDGKGRIWTAPSIIRTVLMDRHI